MDELLVPIREFLTIERLTPLAFAVLRVIAILIAAVIVTKIISRFVTELRSRIVDKMKEHRGGEPTLELEKRAATIGGIIRKTAAIVVWALALAMALREVGFDIAPILAGAGVIGLAVGFGAQNLVRDVITGLFMLMENQVSVNDIAVINGTGGLVEEINLRTTVLRGLDGTVHVFPNGAITTLSNMTREFSFYVFDVGVAYKEDTDRVVEVLHGISEQMRQEEEFRPLILEPLDVLGVDQFGDSAVVVKVRLKTVPGKQWQVGRAMNRRIKKRFDEEGIEIPFPHQSLYFGEASMPFKLQLEGSTREDLKAAIREVLAESKAAGGQPSES
jgi:small conductance mechanosensitive channel